jgi:hypothetical protein
MLRFLSLLGVACLIGTAGCSSSTNPGGTGMPGNADLLHEVKGLISAYSGEFKQGPRGVADLAKYEQGFPLGMNAIRKGDIVVIWGVKMIIEEGGGSQGGTTDVIAYEKKTPTEGGSVLLHDGSVKTMTAQEFTAAPKAKK